jgi:16S rRNA C967 or C1407 C5-methylase (RsmB/RsmF family)/NOL1/NOP2/fmu family ribosome biogenesis protein
LSQSLPLPLLQSLQQIEGFDEAAFIAAHQQPAPVSVRIHPVKGLGLFAEEPVVPWCPEGRYLAARPVFTLDPAFHAGGYYVQEASSMFLQYLWKQLSGDRTNLRVLDLCGAPGGKSTLISAVLDEESLLISNEVIRTRATILEENMTRWGYANTWVSSNDPREFGRRYPGYFDAMIVDAPCSGSGLFRKDGAAVNEWSEDAVNMCSARQQRILADVWPSLKEDGLLFYATCSYSAAEDEQILDWLADEYEVSSHSVTVPEEWGIVTVASPKHQLTGYRFFPHKTKGEGFFIAVLQKKEAAATFYYPKYKGAHSKKAEEQARYLLNDKQFAFLENDRKEFAAIHPGHQPDWHLLKEGLYLRKAGILLGEMAHKDWIPAHDVALAIDRNNALPSVALNTEQALLFLKKEEVKWPEELKKGWYIVTYNGNGLGWIKALSNRVNNYLPKHWRIRMSLPDENPV